MLNLTENLINFAFEYDSKGIPLKTSDIAKCVLRDGVAALCLGMEHHTPKTMLHHYKKTSATGDCPVLGANTKLSVIDAAMLYGLAIHSMDFEPMFMPPTHAVSPVLGALIPLLQTNRGDSSKFLYAFIMGIQFQADLRKATYLNDQQAAESNNHFPFDRNGFHPPGIVGPLGAALACSIYLGLSKEKTAMAIGMASSRASGISGNIGTMAKATHCGNAARVGLESAMMIDSGFTASKNILESGSGWGEVFGGNQFNSDQLLHGMRNLDCFSSPGFAFKKYPAHTAMQMTIDCASQLIGKIDDISKVHQIVVRVPIFNYCDRPYPKDSDEARFSFQFSVAATLLHGDVSVETYCDKNVLSQEMKNILDKIKLVKDPNIKKNFMDMEIEINIDNHLSVKSNSWRGHWKNPASEVDHLQKLKKCLQNKYTELEINNLNKIIMNVEQEEFTELFKLFLQDQLNLNIHTSELNQAQHDELYSSFY